MKIGIIVAMDKELNQLQSMLNSGEVMVQKCGIGKVNAALGAQSMINEFKPDVIISSGCAGGNGDDINVQDIVVGAETTYHDVYCGLAIDDKTIYGQVQGLPARYKADARLIEKAKALDTGGEFKIHFGLTVTGDWLCVWRAEIEKSRFERKNETRVPKSPFLNLASGPSGKSILAFSGNSGRQGFSSCMGIWKYRGTGT